MGAHVANVSVVEGHHDIAVSIKTVVHNLAVFVLEDKLVGLFSGVDIEQEQILLLDHSRKTLLLLVLLSVLRL